MTDFAYDGPIFLVPLSPSYPSSHVYMSVCVCVMKGEPGTAGRV